MKHEKIHKKKVELLGLNKSCKNGIDWQRTLARVMAKIKFLESICSTDQSQDMVFSKGFRAAALRERDKLCITSSALHNIIQHDAIDKACGASYEAPDAAQNAPESPNSENTSPG